MAMKPANRKKYDVLADDLIIATLLIQNCAKLTLLKYLSNQFATNAKKCYPENPIHAASLLETCNETNSNGVTDKDNTHDAESRPI